MTPSYRHTQIAWILIVVAAVMAILILALSLGSGRFEAALLVPLGVILLAVLTFGWMTVTVDDRALTVAMGVGLMRRSIPLTRVRRYELVRNPWYRGVGVRLYSGGISYSVWGFSVVEIVSGDGNMRIGTDEPQALMAAIKAAHAA